MAPLATYQITLLCSNGSLVILDSEPGRENSFPTTTDDATTVSDQGIPEKERHAILYIIVVLLFYSIGIIISIINYLKREKAEIEEEKFYEDYMNFRSDPSKMAHNFRVQMMTDKLRRMEALRDTKQSLSAIDIHRGINLSESRISRKGKSSLKRSSSSKRSSTESAVHLITVVIEPCTDGIQDGESRQTPPNDVSTLSTALGPPIFQDDMHSSFGDFTSRKSALARVTSV